MSAPRWTCRLNRIPPTSDTCGVLHTQRERAEKHARQLRAVVVPLNGEARGMERLDAQADAERAARRN